MRVYYVIYLTTQIFKVNLRVICNGTFTYLLTKVRSWVFMISRAAAADETIKVGELPKWRSMRSGPYFLAKRCRSRWNTAPIWWRFPSIGILGGDGGRFLFPYQNNNLVMIHTKMNDMNMMMRTDGIFNIKGNWCNLIISSISAAVWEASKLPALNCNLTFYNVNCVNFKAQFFIFYFLNYLSATKRLL